MIGEHFLDLFLQEWPLDRAPIDLWALAAAMFLRHKLRRNESGSALPCHYQFSVWAASRQFVPETSGDRT
jgi:hypothetical protein